MKANQTFWYQALPARKEPIEVVIKEVSKTGKTVIVAPVNGGVEFRTTVSTLYDL